MTIYPVSAYLKPWLLPPGLNIFLMCLGTLLKYQWHRLGKSIMLLGFISLWLFSTPIFTYTFLNWLQNQYPLLQVDHLPQRSNQTAIVVLGGGEARLKEFDNKSIASDSTLHRLNYAAYLHKKTHLPIIVSGGKAVAATLSEADLMANALYEYHGIRPLLKEEKSFTTADESKYLRSLLQQHNINTIYLVTNAWHMPRSVYIFKCYGINVIPAPMGYFNYGPGYSILSFLPNKEALHAAAIGLHEWFGLAWYYLRFHRQCLL